MQKPHKIVLFGASLDTGNMGCRALALSLLKILAGGDDLTSFTLIYGHPYPELKKIKISDRTVTVQLLNHRLSRKAILSESLPWNLLLASVVFITPFSSIRGWICSRTRILRAVSEADFIGQITGGDSFSDIYGFSRFLYRTIDCAFPILLRKNLHFLPQTYGPFRLRQTRWLARFYLRNAKTVYTRERASVQILKELFKGESTSVLPQVSPDVAFCLERDDSNKLEILPRVPEKIIGEATIGLNVSGLLWIGGYSGQNMFGLKVDYREFVRRIANEFLKINSCRLVLIPHTFGESAESDKTATLKLFSEYSVHSAKARLHMLDGVPDPAGIKSVIGNCDFFVGSRMHACIAAVSQSVPCAAVAYSDKFKSVFSVISAEKLVVDARSLSMEEIIANVFTLYNDREKIKRELRRSVEVVRENVRATFEKLLDSKAARCE